MQEPDENGFYDTGATEVITFLCFAFVAGYGFIAFLAFCAYAVGTDPADPNAGIIAIWWPIVFIKYAAIGLYQILTGKI